MKKVVILYSGGADSVLMVLMALKMGHAVKLISFRYGQKHVGELHLGAVLAERIWKDRLPTQEHFGRFDHKPLVIDLEEIFQHFESNLLHESEASFGGVHEMHVPARNGIFLFTALGWAETHDYDEVWIGCDYSDRVNLFPDCYQEWIVRMDDLAQISGSKKIHVKAPLLGFTKEDVTSMLQNEGIDLKTVYSGYEAPKPYGEIHAENLRASGQTPQATDPAPTT